MYILYFRFQKPSQYNYKNNLENTYKESSYLFCATTRINMVPSNEFVISYKAANQIIYLVKLWLEIKLQTESLIEKIRISFYLSLMNLKPLMVTLKLFLEIYDRILF